MVKVPDGAYWAKGPDGETLPVLVRCDKAMFPGEDKEFELHPAGDPETPGDFMMFDPREGEIDWTINANDRLTLPEGRHLP